MYSSISEIDERPFVDARPPKEAADIIRGTATPPSMTKCQVSTPVRSRRYAPCLHLPWIPLPTTFSKDGPQPQLWNADQLGKRWMGVP